VSNPAFYGTFYGTLTVAGTRAGRAPSVAGAIALWVDGPR
jgi:hypothetical protein